MACTVPQAASLPPTSDILFVDQSVYGPTGLAADLVATHGWCVNSTHDSPSQGFSDITPPSAGPDYSPLPCGLCLKVFHILRQWAARITSGRPVAILPLQIGSSGFGWA